MQVRHSLTCVPAIVQHKPKPVLSQTKRTSHLRRLKQQVTQKRLILRLSLVDARDRLARDHQDMSRRLGGDVAERHDLVILVYNVRRDFLIADFFKQCLFHWSAAGSLPDQLEVFEPNRETKIRLTDFEFLDIKLPATYTKNE